jgi:hypothetical protein
MPSRKKEPCAKLTIRVTPKIRESPAETKNKDEALAKPLRSCIAKLEKSMDLLKKRIQPKLDPRPIIREEVN